MDKCKKKQRENYYRYVGHLNGGDAPESIKNCVIFKLQ